MLKSEVGTLSLQAGPNIILMHFMNIRLCLKSTCLSHISTSLMTAFQGKRGIEKQPFQLPDFIAATGIEKIRQVRFSPFCSYVYHCRLDSYLLFCILM